MQHPMTKAYIQWAWVSIWVLIHLICGDEVGKQPSHDVSIVSVELNSSGDEVKKQMSQNGSKV